MGSKLKPGTGLELSLWPSLADSRRKEGLMYIGSFHTM